MNTLYSLVLLCIVATHAVLATQSDLELFRAFQTQYGKEYTTTAEWDTRFTVFKNNLRRIEALNAEAGGSTIHAVNQFADMSQEEFKNYPCGGNLIGRFPGKQFPATHNMLDMINPSALPDSFDWTLKGAVTPIKNQGQCGSCWAFSTIANIEGAWFVGGHKLVNLSEAEIVDCTKTSQGCDGGWPFWAMSDILKAPIKGRIDTEESYPYSPQDGKCHFNEKTVGATIKNYTSYCHEETTPCTEVQMQTLLLKHGPLSVCLDALPMQLYVSGVAKPSSCDPTEIDHCVALVGWGVDPTTQEKYWKIKNSWGASWGEKGYYRLIRGLAADQPKGRCGINTVITAAGV